MIDIFKPHPSLLTGRVRTYDLGVEINGRWFDVSVTRDGMIEAIHEDGRIADLSEEEDDQIAAEVQRMDMDDNHKERGTRDE